MPKKTRTARPASALVGGLYPAASISAPAADPPSRRLLLWAHEDGELLERRLLRPDEDDHAAVLSAVERFQARDGVLPQRVVLNSPRLLQLSRAALGDRLCCDEGATPQTDRAAADMVGGLLPARLRPVPVSPGVATDVSVDCLACFFDHAHALFELSPWRALEPHFGLMRLDLGDLGWPRAILELRREDRDDTGFVLYRSLYDWRQEQRLRSAQPEDGVHPEHLELRRVPRRDLQTRIRALMEEFGWLAPMSLQPVPLAMDRDGRPRAPSTGELQLLSAAAIVLERLLHVEESRAPDVNPRSLDATIDIDDELWHAEVAVAAPPAALRGLCLQPGGDPTFGHILRCFACSLDDEDAAGAEFLEQFQRFAATSYRQAAGLAEDAVEEVLGGELLLVYLAPFLADRYLSASAPAPEGFEHVLVLCGKLSRWLAHSRLIDEETLDELCTLFENRRAELIRAARVAAVAATEEPEPRRPFLRALVDLLRLSEGRAWFRGVDGRSWGPIAAANAPWLARIERGWKLDLILRRSEGRLGVERLMGVYPHGIAMLSEEADGETSM